jgi:hypothetical protein
MACCMMTFIFTVISYSTARVMSERYEYCWTVTRRLAEQFWAMVLRLFVTDCLVNILLRAPDFGDSVCCFEFVSVQFQLHMSPSATAPQNSKYRNLYFVSGTMLHMLRVHFSDFKLRYWRTNNRDNGEALRVLMLLIVTRSWWIRCLAVNYVWNNWP